jgi:hypothetical protein
MEALLEGLIWNGLQLQHHVLSDVPEITRSHVRRVESLANLHNAVLGQETLDQV